MIGSRTRQDSRQHITIPRSTLDELQSAKIRQDFLHSAICQAVAILNVSPEVARCADARRARDILRQVLIDHADAVQAQEAGR